MNAKAVGEGPPPFFARADARAELGSARRRPRMDVQRDCDESACAMSGAKAVSPRATSSNAGTIGRMRREAAGETFGLPRDQRFEIAHRTENSEEARDRIAAAQTPAQRGAD